MDAAISDRTAVYLGAGILFPFGTYLRSGLVAGAGVTDGRGSFRLDFTNAFHVDPFRESRWGPYGGGGISVRHDVEGGRTNPVLFVFLGLEGPLKNGRAPAFEMGIGGGIRAGIIIRTAQPNRR